jgi:hypothetical protein
MTTELAIKIVWISLDKKKKPKKCVLSIRAAWKNIVDIFSQQPGESRLLTSARISGTMDDYG